MEQELDPNFRSVKQINPDGSETVKATFYIGKVALDSGSFIIYYSILGKMEFYCDPTLLKRNLSDFYPNLGNNSILSDLREKISFKVLCTEEKALLRINRFIQ